jgi:hypothetical protein
VERALDEAFERWDGKGLPAGRKGKDVSMTDKEVASKLGISHRTVHHHDKHTYDKIGVSTRAPARARSSSPCDGHSSPRELGERP